MKTNVLLLIFIVLGFSACSIYQPYPAGSKPTSTLSPIPTMAHKNKVDVFFPGEEVKEEYIKIQVLEITGNERSSYQSMLDRMITQAQQKGADGIIILRNTRNSKIVSDETAFETFTEAITGEEIPDNYSSEVSQKLYGIGIKYKSKIDYLDKIIKTKKIYLLENGAEELVGTQNYNIKGTLLNQEGVDLYYNLVRNYSLDYLIYDYGPGWTYGPKTSDNFFHRKYKTGIQTIKKVSFYYDDKMRIGPVKIQNYRYTTNTLSKDREEVQCFYFGDTDRMQSKKITLSDKSEMVEEFIYDEREKLLGSKIYKLQGTEKTPFLEIRYEFFKNEDLESFLR